MSGMGNGNPPLARNRNYTILWGGQVVSEVGFSTSLIAYPLLALAITGSPAISGLVLGIDAAAQLLAGLPAGALADRWNRRTVMLSCEAAQAAAVASLVLALWWDALSVPHMVAVAAATGVCRALFEPAEDACLATVVPSPQLPTAVAMNSARTSLGQLSGTALGGFLFAAGRAVPFALDAISHAAAFCALWFLRIPARTAAPAAQRRIGREIAEGLRWMWRQPHVRAAALCAVSLNLFFTAYYIVIIVLARDRGVPPGEIGVMAAMLGVGGILGSLVAPRLHRALRPYVAVAGVFWAVTALSPLAAVVHGGYAMGLLFAGMALLAPTANTTITTYQLLLTPDRLRGRMAGVMGVATGAAAAAGPALGGLLVQVTSGTRAVLLCTAGIAAVTTLATLSPTMRRFPTITEEGQPDMDEDDARYLVLRNDEDQYSLWRTDIDVPAGWHPVGKEGSRDECMSHVDEVWTDMRPRSLREQMESDQRAGGQA